MEAAIVANQKELGPDITSYRDPIMMFIPDFISMVSVIE